MLAGTPPLDCRVLMEVLSHGHTWQDNRANCLHVEIWPLHTKFFCRRRWAPNARRRRPPTLRYVRMLTLENQKETR